MDKYYIPPGMHKLPNLPYDTDSLEPVISEKSLKIHHNILHKGYVENLNKAELALVEARKNNDYKYIQYWEDQLAYNGSGHILHSIYWTSMSPINEKNKPEKNMVEMIEKTFGSFDNFKKQFTNASLKVQGPGWGILCYNPVWNRLVILTAGKHQNLTQWSAIPILIIDVWEHAYYLDYQYRRKKYIDEWWKLVNWDEVEKRLQIAQKCHVPIYLSEKYI